jgi:phage terminase Nu1 subunit (DNA packaging protein)
MNYIAGGMPFVTKADRASGTPWEFSLSECKEWLADRDAELQASHSQKQKEQEEDAGIVAARIAKLNVETERLELRLARERGELVPIDRVAEIVESQMTTLRTHLLALPIKLAPVLVGHDVEGMKEKITAYIREALEELAEDKVIEQVTPDQVDELVHGEEKAHPLDAVLGIEDADFGN